MRASRRYFTSIMAAAVTLCTFLATFIIFGMVLASAIVGPQFLSPTAHIGCNQFYLAAPSNLPCPRSSLHLYKVTQVLGAIALGCLLFGYVFNTLGLADLESDAVRDSYLKTRNGAYNINAGYGEVISPSLYFWLGVLFTCAGVCTVLAAVCAAVASSVTRHDWAFHAVVTILVFSAVVASLLFIILLLMRREAPIQQAEFVQYNNNIAMAPIPAGTPVAAP